MKHGFAVAVGMIVEARISVLTKNLKENEEERIKNLIEAFGFPMSDLASTSKIMELMKSDKKSKGNKPRFVIVEKIGKVKSEKNNFSYEVDSGIVEKAIEECKK